LAFTIEEVDNVVFVLTIGEIDNVVLFLDKMVLTHNAFDTKFNF
jgi:hypothetical protein